MNTDYLFIIRITNVKLLIIINSHSDKKWKHGMFVSFNIKCYYFWMMIVCWYLENKYTFDEQNVRNVGNISAEKK